MVDTIPPSLQSILLARSENIRHGFFTRIGGVSRGDYESLNCSLGSGDEHTRIGENRSRVASALGARSLCSNQQVHGNRVRVITSHADASRLMEADGIVTDQPGIALGALGADCAPVLFTDGDAGVIGVAHAGWQGALSGITDSVIDAMVSIGARENAIVAAIGPAIHFASYEVGETFRARFMERSPVACADCFSIPEQGRDVHFDLPGYIRLRLDRRALGDVDCLGVDTYTDEGRFFSYRRSCHRQEAGYGRQIGAICLSARREG